MTPLEWCLMEEGAIEALVEKAKRTARWLSPLVSATAGKAFTPSEVAAAAGFGVIAEQLLDDSSRADTENESASALRAADRKYKAMMRQIAKTQKGNQCPAS